MQRKSFVTLVILMWIQISETKLGMKRLTSPNFPQIYPQSSENDTMEYYNGLSDYRIKVVVKTLDINLKDTLTIYDREENCEKPLSNHRVLRELSGLKAKATQLPLTFFSLSNGICLNFDRRFGGMDVYTGYEIEIYEFPRCKGAMTDEHGDIVSPNYNYEEYQESARCEWRIPGHETGEAVQFTVQEFNVGCKEGDDVTIIDGRSTTSLCQQKNLSPGSKCLATNSPVKLKFTSLSRSKGFWLKYEIVGCAAPKLPASYGSPRNPATYYPYNYRVEYRCEPGHWYGEGRTALLMTCQTNGNWSSQGINIKQNKCQLVDCGDPGTPSDGHRAVSKGQFSYRSTVTFHCDPDFSLEGSAERTCLANGTWSGVQPYCKGKTTECSLPADPPQGSRLGNQTGFGQSVSFRCNDGYKLEGKQEITCLNTGKWSDPVPKCQVLTCPAPQAPEDGILVSTGKAVFKYGDSVAYQCNTGYRMVASGNGILECLKNGTWDEKPPTCEAITCWAPPLPAHGSATWTSLQFGSEARYFCDPGYQLDGEPSTYCRMGGWTPATPVCKPELCPSLTNDSLTNAYVTSAHVSQPNGLYHFGQSAGIVCEDGYSMRPGELITWMRVECTAGGAWSSDVSRGCPYEIECPPLTDLPPWAELVTGNETSFASEMVIVCRVSGLNETITCTGTGEWSVPPSQLCPGEGVNIADHGAADRNHTEHGTARGNHTEHGTARGNHTEHGTARGNHTEHGTAPGNHTDHDTARGNHTDHDTADRNHTDHGTVQRNHTDHGTVQRNHTDHGVTNDNHTGHGTANGRTLTSEQRPSDDSWWIILLAISGGAGVLAAILILLLRSRRRKTQKEGAVEAPEKHEYDNPAYGVDPDYQVILSSNGDASFKRGDDWQSNPTYHNANRTLERPDSVLTEGIYANPEELQKPSAANRLTTFS